MDTFNLSCPSCGTTLKTNASAAGKRVKCPKCNDIFTAPTAAAAPVATSAAIQSAPRSAPPPVPTTSSWRPKQRVFAQWNDGFWYPATVQNSDTQSVRVAYDDGAAGLVEWTQVCAMELTVGARVFCRWKEGPEYHPAKVGRVSGEEVHVLYDDGDQETSTVSMLRVVRGKLPWKVGDRVLAQWMPEPYYYPARITEITDDIFLTVAYEDGDGAILLAVQVRSLDLRAGDRVFCKWQAGPAYFPGRIAEKNGDDIHVHYDDGEKESSQVRMVRVLPEHLVRTGE